MKGRYRCFGFEGLHRQDGVTKMTLFSKGTPMYTKDMLWVTVILSRTCYFVNEGELQLPLGRLQVSLLQEDKKTRRVSQISESH